MNGQTWETLAGPVTVPADGAALLLDPDGLDDIPGVEVVTDRWRLRQLLEELSVKRADSSPMLMHLQIRDVRRATGLPFDARSIPLRIVDLRAAPAVVAEARKLPRSVLRELVGPGALAARAGRAAAVAADLAWPVGLDLQVVAAVRLATFGPQLRSAVAQTLPNGWLRQTLLAPDPLAVVAKEAHEWWEHGANPQLDPALRAAEPELRKLVAAGVIEPPTTAVAPTIPIELRNVVGQQQDKVVLTRLLANLGALPDDLVGWLRTADDWATTRRLLTQLLPEESEELQNSAWDRWEELNRAWISWLQRHYGTLLNRSPVRPIGVHQIAPFLNHRRRGTPHRTMLLVLDGLGLPQWQLLKRDLELVVIEEQHVLASLPTITSVSRQAIFAGQLPNAFAEDSRTTAREGVHWDRFWTAQGLRPDQFHYAKTSGATARDWKPLQPGVEVAGLAVSAPDKLLHGSEVFGDRQLAQAITSWAREGYLAAAIAWCQDSGVHLWITSDHGNLPTTTNDFEPKNLTTNRVGHRVAFKTKEIFRRDVNHPELAWTPPGFGAAVETLGYPYFAPGRKAFTATSNIVAHGGLSIDEVVVPLVRIV